MIWHDLRNAKIIQGRLLSAEERLSYKKLDKRAHKLFKKYGLEQFMIDACIDKSDIEEAFGAPDAEKWATKGDKLSKSFDNKRNNCSTSEMYEMVQKYEIDPIEKKDIKLLTEGDKEKLEAAKDLQLRLSIEALKKEDK